MTEASSIAPRRIAAALLAVVLATLVLAAGRASAAGAPGAHASTEGTATATLTALNRDIITFRASLLGTPPKVRVDRAVERLVALQPSEIEKPIHSEPVQYGSEKGVQIMVGDRPLFMVLEGDVDPTSGQSFQDLVKQTVGRVEDVRQAWRDTRRWSVILNALLRAVLATIVLAALVYAINRSFRAGIGWLEQRRDYVAAGGGRVTFREFLARFVVRVARIVKWVLYLMLGYAWATYVLERFPLTQPIGERLGQFIIDTITWVGDGIVAGLPGMITVVIVLGVTRAITDVLGYFFENVQRGRLRVPYLYPETVGATRRIVTVFAWCLGIAIAYPFIPGSQSEAFKGLSVLIGLMISLGSTGLVTQAMGGLVIVYSRALRKGDFVRVGDAEGVVTEVGSLATKVVNVRNEEITIPNSVLVGTAIYNYSKLAGTQGTLLTSKVTIGYDAPWRQVHALLVAAAEKTPKVRREPAPYVYQRALSDFYVEYELFVHVDDAAQRIPILSTLHAAIQDEFNAAGVQIMSPHFFSQPEQPVTVPKSRWFAGIGTGAGPGPHAGERDAA